MLCAKEIRDRSDCGTEANGGNGILQRDKKRHLLYHFKVTWGEGGVSLGHVASSSSNMTVTVP